MKLKYYYIPLITICMLISICFGEPGITRSTNTRAMLSPPLTLQRTQPKRQTTQTAPVPRRAVTALREPKRMLNINPNRFRDITRIGAGNWGTVYEAWDTQFNRRVAIKRPSQAGSLEHIKQAQGILKNEINILRSTQNGVYGINGVPGYIHSYLDDDPSLKSEPYLVMEFYENITPLNEYAKTHSFQEVLDVFIKILSIIEQAHARGIVHQDLKPDDIVVKDNGEVIILDWGMASEETEGPLEEVTGTPQFSSTHQLLAWNGVNKSNDVGILGAVLYTLIIGDYPFKETSIKQIEEQIKKAILAQIEIRDPEKHHVETRFSDKYSIPQAKIQNLMRTFENKTFPALDKFFKTNGLPKLPKDSPITLDIFPKQMLDILIFGFASSGIKSNDAMLIDLIKIIYIGIYYRSTKAEKNLSEKGVFNELTKIMGQALAGYISAPELKIELEAFKNKMAQAAEKYEYSYEDDMLKFCYFDEVGKQWYQRVFRISKANDNDIYIGKSLDVLPLSKQPHRIIKVLKTNGYNYTEYAKLIYKMFEQNPILRQYNIEIYFSRGHCYVVMTDKITEMQKPFPLESFSELISEPEKIPEKIKEYTYYQRLWLLENIIIWIKIYRSKGLGYKDFNGFCNSIFYSFDTHQFAMIAPDAPTAGASKITKLTPSENNTIFHIFNLLFPELPSLAGLPDLDKYPRPRNFTEFSKLYKLLIKEKHANEIALHAHISSLVKGIESTSSYAQKAKLYKQIFDSYEEILQKYWHTISKDEVKFLSTLYPLYENASYTADIIGKHRLALEYMQKAIQARRKLINLCISENTINLWQYRIKQMEHYFAQMQAEVKSAGSAARYLEVLDTEIFNMRKNLFEPIDWEVICHIDKTRSKEIERLYVDSLAGTDSRTYHIAKLHIQKLLDAQKHLLKLLQERNDDLRGIFRDYLNGLVCYLSDETGEAIQHLYKAYVACAQNPDLLDNPRGLLVYKKALYYLGLSRFREHLPRVAVTCFSTASGYSPERHIEDFHTMLEIKLFEIKSSIELAKINIVMNNLNDAKAVILKTQRLFHNLPRIPEDSVLHKEFNKLEKDFTENPQFNQLVPLKQPAGHRTRKITVSHPGLTGQIAPRKTKQRHFGISV